MRFLIAAGLCAVAALVQSVEGPSLPLVRGRPDSVLVVVMAWAMLRGSGEGAFVGFLGGALLDSVTYTQFGINSALFGLVGKNSILLVDRTNDLRRSGLERTVAWLGQWLSRYDSDVYSV